MADAPKKDDKTADAATGATEDTPQRMAVRPEPHHQRLRTTR